MKIRINELVYHRNGVGGEPFYAVNFTDYSEKAGDMVAAVFDTPGHVAVFCIGRLPSIQFGYNSWRGDKYEGLLREAIAAHRDGKPADIYGED